MGQAIKAGDPHVALRAPQDDNLQIASSGLVFHQSSDAWCILESLYLLTMWLDATCPQVWLWLSLERHNHTLTLLMQSSGILGKAIRLCEVVFTEAVLMMSFRRKASPHLKTNGFMPHCRRVHMIS